ncbi:MAG: PQQ-dependent sugar dehydrogenase [Phycisphaerales bacterium]|nr:PQQ-dependent sugar dehydrogenase [Phycisphaerales bacterium]
MRRARYAPALCAGFAMLAFVLCAADAGGAIVVPRDFVDETVFGGHIFSGAAALRFTSTGKVFVAERSGIIKVFDSVDDPTPTVFADLRTNVYAAYDRGLLGMTVHPNFAVRPLVYVLYTRDAELGGPAPLWNDTCPDPPGVFGDGCVVSSRLSSLRADGDVMIGSENVLIDDWCQQYSSHSAGDLRFGPDGMLYAGHGEGANFQMADTGGLGGNPCGDPPKEGGALRAQDILTPGDPVSLHGSIIRLHPITGMPLSDSPLFGGADSNDDYIVAHGFRNPYRFTFRPGTSEIWIGDVGWNTWEEINRLIDPVGAPVENFGWPCYEGSAPQPSYAAKHVPICEGLYANGGVTAPFYKYQHTNPSGNAITGITFYDGATFPAEYDGALFFADYNEGTIHIMYPDANGVPDPGTLEVFASGLLPVDLEIGPDGSLYHIFFTRSGPTTIHRIRYSPPDRSAAVLVDCMNGPNVTPTPMPPQTVAECLRAFDLDDDGDVDLADYGSLQDRVPLRVFSPADTSDIVDCLDGPGAPPAPTLPHMTPAKCIELFDLEGHDGDVDLRDFAFFIEAFPAN